MSAGNSNGFWFVRGKFESCKISVFSKIANKKHSFCHVPATNSLFYGEAPQVTSTERSVSLCDWKHACKQRGDGPRTETFKNTPQKTEQWELGTAITLSIWVSLVKNRQKEYRNISPSLMR